MGGDEPHRLTLSIGVDGCSEGRDFPFGRLEIAEPKLGIARKTDPNRFVPGPLRGRDRWGRLHGPRLTGRPAQAKRPENVKADPNLRGSRWCAGVRPVQRAVPGRSATNAPPTQGAAPERGR